MYKDNLQNCSLNQSE